eukprot:g8867.t1
MFERLGIGHRVVELLYEYFQCIDRDGSGEIDLKEFFTFFQMKDTAFARRAFSVMDEDGSGEIDFGEFVLTVWNYATFTKEGLTRFAFELYDEDHSGFIDMDEMMMILRQMFGKRYKTNAMANKLMKQVLSFDWRGDGACDPADVQIDFRAFNGFCKKHPGLLFPAFHIQMDLQQGMLGTAFWTDVAHQQEKIASAQRKLQVKSARSGAKFSSNEIVIKSDSESGDILLFNKLNGMTSETALGDQDAPELDIDPDPPKARPVGRRRPPGKSVRNKIETLSGKKKKNNNKRASKSRASEEENRAEDKKKLKEKIKKQLKQDRKMAKRKAEKEQVKEYQKKGIIGKMFAGTVVKQKTSDNIDANDPRRNLLLMKRNRQEKKTKAYVVDIDRRRTTVRRGGGNKLPWVCTECHRSNFPDSTRCRTCKAKPG